MGEGWLFFSLFFNLHRFLPNLFGLRKAHSLHDGGKCNFKKKNNDNKTDYICLFILKVDELISTVDVFNLGTVVNGPVRCERKGPGLSQWRG